MLRLGNGFFPKELWANEPLELVVRTKLSKAPGSL